MAAALSKRYDHFGGRRQEWSQYLNDAKSQGLYEFTKESECKIWGPFSASAAVLAVGRSKDAMQRKITASVPANFMMRMPADVLPPKLVELGMMGPAMLATVRTNCSRVAWATAVQVSAFTAVETPRFWWPLFTGPRIKTRDLDRRPLEA